MSNVILVKSGLHIVLTIAQHARDRVLKRVLKLSTYRLQIFLVKYEYMRSLKPCENQGIHGKLKKKLFANMCLRSLLLIWKPDFKCESCSENVKQGRFQRFEAMAEKQTFHPVSLLLSRVNKNLL